MTFQKTNNLKGSVYKFRVTWILTRVMDSSVSLCKPDWEGGASQPQGRSNQRGVSSEWMALAPGHTAAWPTCPWASSPVPNTMQRQTPADAQGLHGRRATGQPAWRWEGHLCVMLQSVGPSGAPRAPELRAWLYWSHLQSFLPRMCTGPQGLWIRMV